MSPAILQQPALPAWLPLDALAEFCKKWHIRELYLFGSALREDFLPESDVDLLYAQEPEDAVGLFGLMEMEEELEGLLERPVDLVSKRAVEGSSNFIRRKSILGNCVQVYAS